MALRQLMISRKLEELREKLEILNQAHTEIATKRSAWSEREAMAVQALEEINEQTTDEERSAFESEADEIETENKELTEQESQNDADIANVNGEIESLQNELNELNERAKKPTPTKAITKSEKKERRGNYMRISEEIREACTHDEVRTFLTELREKRGVTNAVYTVPEVMLPMLTQAVEKYSKLSKYVSNTTIKGDSQLNLLGAVPAATWTDAAAAINEITFGVSQLTIGGYKVAAYVPMPNAYLEDSDENLAAVVLDNLAQSIGYAKDKAILYGTGTNMPVGILPRLAATEQPAWWGAKQGTFTALNTTNIGKASANTVSGTKLFAEMANVLGKAKEVYANGTANKFWAMNATTWLKLRIELLNMNATGALVSGINNEMPIIGGAVEILDFIPDNVIVGGYGSQYKYVTRAGIQLKESEHAMFIADQTVYAAVERADGKPIAGEGFAAFSLTTTAVSATIA